MAKKLRQVRAALLAATILGAALAPALPAHADPTTAENTKLLLVLDVSGSMKEDDKSGESKMDAAKKALTEVVNNLPADSQVGLRVYGAKVKGGKPTPEACADTQLVQPIGPIDKAALTNEINSFTPKGETPIAYSLEKSLEDVGDTGKRNIILVSDGEESCVPDPCEAIKKVIGSGIDLQIDTVGLAVNSKAKEELQCIAKEGNGTYYPADNADELASSLNRLSTRAMQPFTIAGQPITAGATATAAPEITAGQYTDKIAVDANEETEYWYKIRRNLTGSTMRVGMVGRLPYAKDFDEGVNQGYWNYNFFAADMKTQCDADAFAANDTYGIGTFATGTVVGLGLDPAKSQQSDKEESCANDQDLYLQVKHSKGNQTTVPVEIKVIEEPPVTNAATLPAGIEEVPDIADEAPESPASGTPIAAVGGYSFNDAALIEPGTYATEIVPGERVFFRVHVDWGQSAVFALDGTNITWPGGLSIEEKSEAIVIGTDIFSPDRGTLNSNIWNPIQFYEQGTSPHVLNMELPQVRYRNRWDSPTLDQHLGFAVAGDYYYSIYIGRDALGGKIEGVPVPVKFSIGVTGEVTGVPEYTEPFDMAAVQQGVTPSVTGNESAAPSASPSPSTSATEVPTPTNASSPPWRLILLGGGAVALVAGAGTLLFLARRRGKMARNVQGPPRT